MAWHGTDITWTNDDQVHGIIYASPGFNELIKALIRDTSEVKMKAMDKKLSALINYTETPH